METNSGEYKTYWVDGYYPTSQYSNFNLDDEVDTKNVKIIHAVCKTTNKKNAVILALRSFKEQLSDYAFQNIQVVIYENNVKGIYVKESKFYFEFYVDNDLRKILKKSDIVEEELN